VYRNATQTQTQRKRNANANATQTQTQPNANATQRNHRGFTTPEGPQLAYEKTQGTSKVPQAQTQEKTDLVCPETKPRRRLAARNALPVHEHAR
jgi:predicted secreted Zn-dependent protease